MEGDFMDKQILVAEEVAELLRVDKQRVYELVRTKKIPVIKLGERQYRFSCQAILRWLENGGSGSETRHEERNGDSTLSLKKRCLPAQGVANAAWETTATIDPRFARKGSV